MKFHQIQHHIGRVPYKDYKGNLGQQNVIPLSISTITNECLHQTSIGECSTTIQNSKDKKSIEHKIDSEGGVQPGSLEAKDDDFTRYHKLRKYFSDSKTESLQPVRVSPDDTKEPDKLENDTGLETGHSQQQLFTEKKPKMLPQVLCATVIAVTQLGNAIMFSISGIILPQLIQPESKDIYLPPAYASLFGSIITIGTAIGGLMCGYAIRKIGHLKSIIFIQPILFSLWCLLAYSSDPAVVVATRGFMGIMAGIVAPCSTAYILEIAHKDHRGILFAAIPTAKQMGYILTSLLGMTSLSWRHIALICGVPTTVLPFIGLFFFPRSPRWLMPHGMTEEAKKSLIFFRGENCDSQCELEDIIEQVQKDKNIRDIPTQLKELVRKPIANTFLLLTFLSTFGNIHGSQAVISFTVIIFQDSSVTDAYTCATLIAIMRMVGNVFYVVLIDRIGRRPLYITSYAAIGLTLGLLGTSFYIKEFELLGDQIDWLLLISVLMYNYFITFGLSVLSMLQGELLPTSVRSTGISMLFSMTYLGAFVVAVGYFPMEAVLGQYGTFWTFGAGSLIVAIVIHFALPETKGRSLEEISDGRKATKIEKKTTH